MAGARARSGPLPARGSPHTARRLPGWRLTEDTSSPPGSLPLRPPVTPRTPVFHRPGMLARTFVRALGVVIHRLWIAVLAR